MATLAMEHSPKRRRVSLDSVDAMMAPPMPALESTPAWGCLWKAIANEPTTDDVGALVGTKSAGALLKATGRTSIIVFFLASILLGSGVLMVATGVIQLQKVGITSFRPICGRAGAAARVD